MVKERLSCEIHFKFLFAGSIWNWIWFYKDSENISIVKIYYIFQLTRPSFPFSQSLPSGSFHKPLILILQRADRMKTTIRKLSKLITWITALSNSVKLWAIPGRATQDGRVMVESSDKTWSTGEGNGKPLQYSCHENPMNGMKKQKDRTLRDELPRSVGTQYATGDQWRNNSRKNEGMEPKQKQ